MTKSIFNSEKFQTDLQRYKSSLEKITDEEQKKEVQKLITDLTLNVKRMDNMYLDMVYSGQLTSIGGEMREKIIDIRKKLDSKLKLYLGK